MNRLRFYTINYANLHCVRYSLVIVCWLMLCASKTTAQPQLQPIGQWREHLPYQSAIQVTGANGKVYAATPYNVFSVEEDGTINRLSKTTGLSDVGVSAIAWDELTSQLVIAYTNSNIDVVKNRVVKNISDVKRSSISGDKTVYHIYCFNGKAYLSTGIGIIVVDLIRYEISDTWKIGANGNQLKVNGITAAGNTWYAATEEGLKQAAINGNNLADYRNWTLAGNANGLPAGPVQSVITINNQPLVQKHDSLYTLAGNNWSLFSTDAGWTINNINSTSGKLLISQVNTAGASRVKVVNSAGITEQILAQPGVISFPKQATIVKNAIWVADLFGGLSKFTTTVERFIPTGPLGVASGEIAIHNNLVYIAAGAVNDAWNYQYNRNGIYTFDGSEWNNINSFNRPELDTVLDIITLAIDPRNGSTWAGSYGGGLVNISTNGAITVFKQNSTLQTAIGDPTSYRVSGLSFDNDGNLWISNYGAAQNLHVLKSDGSFKAFAVPFFYNENAVSQLLIDDANQLWIVSPKGNGLFVYNHGDNIDNTNDDRWKYMRAGAGNGNLPTNEVYCVAKDRNGFIWIGTSRGIGVVQCAEQLFDPQGCEAVLPVVQQDRFAGYLFQDEEVRTIAVDGANRKWVGTKNGVWLISADGDKVIYRFTEDNSPLLSNDIKRIAINQQTGEVFISTFKGICSFRSTATEGNMSNENVLVFPNPVPPLYNGTIAIRGVSNNAIVKIAELNGKLVYQTRALGGQAVWNGRNYKGEKIASGFYLVLVKDETGSERMVTKVVITGGR